MAKKFYLSKTFWVNILAAVAIIGQSVTDHEILAPEAQVGILAVVNLILRAVTKEPLEW